MQVQNTPSPPEITRPLRERLPAPLLTRLREVAHDYCFAENVDQVVQEIGTAVADELERRDLILKPFLANAAYSLGRAQSILSIRDRETTDASRPPAEPTARGPRVADPQGIKNAEAP